MAIAHTVERYLHNRGLDYTLLPHPHTRSSMDTAAAAHVPGDRLAKAVIVNRGSEPLMVVVPSDYHVHLGRLHEFLGDQVGLASEDELTTLFPDCARGAIPPVGSAYGLKMLVDDRLLGEPELFLESGDHESLLQIDGATFRALMCDAEAVDLGVHV